MAEDFIDPDFTHIQRVHDWKNYVTDDIESIWYTFNDTQKKSIGKMLQEIADREEWE